MILKLKQLVQINDNILNIMTYWMYNWWGVKEGYIFDAVKCFMKHSLQKNRLPQTYGLFLDDTIIGMFQFTYGDLNVRPDIYPWLANVYIDEKYRNMGYGRKLLESVPNIAKENMNFNTIFLYNRKVIHLNKCRSKFTNCN